MESLVEYQVSLEPPPVGEVCCSIIVPVYDEEENLDALHERIRAEMGAFGVAYEVIYVDDGSRDRSFAHLRAIAAQDPHVVAIQFRRNFGQTAALAAGIAHSVGRFLVFLDADLQNDPADIPLLLAKLDEGFDVVSGWRVDRQDAALSRRLPSRLANGLISLVTGVHLHDYGCTLKAYRREVVQHVHLYGEMHRFIPAHAAWVGARITEIPVRHHPRLHGRSKYGIGRTLKVVLDLLTVKFLGSYSTKPIYVFGGLGMTTILLSFVAGVALLVQKFAIGVSMIQSPLLLLAAMLFIIGVQLILMGFLAELSVRTYHESQAKPTYFVRQIVRQRE